MGDLLQFYPRDYEDRSQITADREAARRERATIRAKVLTAEKFRSGRGRGMGKVLVEDATGQLTCTWFNARYFSEENFPVGREMILSGRVDFY